MRFWDRAINPDSRSAHSHGRATVPIKGQFGERPLFSRSDDEEQEPSEDKLATEGRLDDLRPTDESATSKARAEVYKEETLTEVILPYSSDNVNYPPTKAQIVTAFGLQPLGFAGFIADGGGAGVVWLCIRSSGDTWYRILATKAT